MSNGEVIDKEDAETMISRWQENNPTDVKAHLFDAPLIRQMLNETGTAGIRIYHGLNNSGAHVLILVCADENGDDLADNSVVEMATTCPPGCNYESFFSH